MAIVGGTDDAIHNEAMAKFLADHDNETARLVRKGLNGFTAFATVYAAALGAAASFSERPVWPLGVALGSAFGVLLLLWWLFVYLTFDRIIRDYVDGDDLPEYPLTRMVVTAAAVLVVLLVAYVLDTQDRKYARAGFMWAANAVAATGVLIWWLFVGRRSGDGDGQALAASYELTLKEIPPV